MSEEKGQKELTEKVISIDRVSKVAKGGRRFSFSALAIVGDQAGSVSEGIGKANEVPDAIRKAIEGARRTLRKMNITHKNTLPHEVVGVYKSSKVYLRPATKGTGLIAGEAVRAVLEQLGLHDVMTKVIGSKNTVNVVRATINALTQLEIPLIVARRRGISLDQLFNRNSSDMNAAKKGSIIQENGGTKNVKTNNENTHADQLKEEADEDEKP